MAAYVEPASLYSVTEGHGEERTFTGDPAAPRNCFVKAQTSPLPCARPQHGQSLCTMRT